jgi:surface protein
MFATPPGVLTNDTLRQYVDALIRHPTTWLGPELSLQAHVYFHRYPIESWDVSQVTDMSYLFANSSFKEDISRWDVGKVTNMCCMFVGAAAFNQPLESWNVGAVTNMCCMFVGGGGKANKMLTALADNYYSKGAKASQMLTTLADV